MDNLAGGNPEPKVDPAVYVAQVKEVAWQTRNAATHAYP
jgi:hypothetical protein